MMLAKFGLEKRTWCLYPDDGMLHSLIARRRFGPQTQLRPLRKTLTSGLGLDDMSLAWPTFNLLWKTVELAMSTRLCLL